MNAKTAWILKIAAAVLFAAAAITLIAVNSGGGEAPTVVSQIELPFLRDKEAMEKENYTAQNEVCPVAFISENGKYRMTVELTFEQWQRMPADVGRDGDVYLLDNGGYVAFDHILYRNEKGELDREAVDAAIKEATETNPDRYKPMFAAIALFTAAAVALALPVPKKGKDRAEGK